jgi:hypothetical protein
MRKTHHTPYTHKRKHTRKKKKGFKRHTHISRRNPHTRTRTRRRRQTHPHRRTHHRRRHVHRNKTHRHMHGGSPVWMAGAVASALLLLNIAPKIHGEFTTLWKQRAQQRAVWSENNRLNENYGHHSDEHVPSVDGVGMGVGAQLYEHEGPAAPIGRKKTPTTWSTYQLPSSRSSPSNASSIWDPSKEILDFLPSPPR